MLAAHLSQAAAVVAEDKHFAGLHHHDLWTSPLVIGICVYAVLLLLLSLCYAFRSIGKRH